MYCTLADENASTRMSLSGQSGVVPPSQHAPPSSRSTTCSAARSVASTQAPSARLPNGPRALLSLFAAVITFAIYRWERKNLATCTHFCEWAAVLERDYFKGHLRVGEEGIPGSPPHGEVSDPKFLGMSWGKTEAAALLYRTAILGWMLTAAYALTL